MDYNAHHKVSFLAADRRHTSSSSARPTQLLSAHVVDTHTLSSGITLTQDTDNDGHNSLEPVTRMAFSSGIGLFVGQLLGLSGSSLCLLVSILVAAAVDQVNLQWRDRWWHVLPHCMSLCIASDLFVVHTRFLIFAPDFINLKYCKSSLIFGDCLLKLFHFFRCLGCKGKAKHQECFKFLYRTFLSWI